MLMSVAPVMASEKMAERGRCLACHDVKNRKVGPSFQAIAERYRDKEGAAEYLMVKAQSGGGGVWGGIMMPANPQVNKGELVQIIDWILSLPSPE